MGWIKSLFTPEHRQDSYTDALVAAIQARSAGVDTAFPTATAALEACTGFIGRAFASAEVKGDDRGALDALTLSTIGRSMIRRGEYVAAIRVTRAGRIRLAPAASWDVTGSEDPESWRYRLELAGPGSQRSVSNLPPEGVVHIRYCVDPAAPWRGLAPLTIAALAGRLSAETSALLADEMSGPRGSLLPQPNIDGTDPAVEQLRADIAGLSGSLALVESQSDSYGTDRGQGQSGNDQGWNVKRIGGRCTIRKRADRVAGVHRSLRSLRVDGVIVPELWRVRAA